MLNVTARAQQRDIAIRIALGARRRQLIKQVLRDGAKLVSVGSFLGLLGAVILFQRLIHIAPGLESPKLWVWITGPTVLAGTLAIAGILPARRALMLDPLRVLRGR
jgi:ABC-type antimicrobial peptide transport system permease subunit